MTKIHRRKILTTMAGGAGFLAFPTLLRAQEKWPVNTIKIIVPAPAGGGVDIFCRKLAELLAPRLDTTIIMDNKAGGAGLLGVKALASAPPNGSAFGYVHTGIASIQAMGGKIDLQKELNPIVGRIQASSYVVAVNSDSPYKTMADLYKAMKADPKKLSYGTGGPGTPAHIIFEKIKLEDPGLDAVQIPFKGAIEGVMAVLGKNIDFVVGLTSAALPSIQSGKLRALALASPKRSRLLPNVPTLVESGLPKFNYSSWAGIFSPVGLPEPLVARMRAEIYNVMADPAFEDFVDNSGAAMLSRESPEAFKLFLNESLIQEAALVKRLGLSV
jgi:tripartite-type tricarboxylate transporter receptor subunit TctC